MKVALYCRLSEEDRNKQFETDDSESIQNQKSMLTQYADTHGWEIYDIYSDDDYAGADRRRPEFNRLLNDAEAHKFDIVLCKTQSRFTRELELVEKYIHGLFPMWGIRFVSIVDNADTAVKGNKKSRQINGLVNEWYLEDMSENIKSVLTNRRMNGLHIGAFALYGYKKDPDQKGHLIIDEEAAAVVREVFTLFSQGYGKTAIARMLNDRGIPNPTEYKHLHGLRYQQPKRKNSTLWKYFAISDMLTNEIYIGNMVQGKYGSISYKTKINKPRPKEEWYIVRGTHEPIIDRELWDRVQAMIAQKAKPFSTGKIGLFARKVVCANCGYTMRSGKTMTTRNDKKIEYRYLKCSNQHVSNDACIGAYINVDKLEQKILDELNKMSEEFINTDEVARNIEWNTALTDKKEKIVQEMTEYQNKIDDYTKGMRDMYMDKVKGLITEADYHEFTKDISRERKRLETQFAEAQKSLEIVEEKLEKGDNRTELLEQYRHMEHLTREADETLIDHISVGKRDKKTNTQQIEIFWNF